MPLKFLQPTPVVALNPHLPQHWSVCGNCSHIWQKVSSSISSALPAADLQGVPGRYCFGPRNFRFALLCGIETGRGSSPLLYALTLIWASTKFPPLLFLYYLDLEKKNENMYSWKLKQRGAEPCDPGIANNKAFDGDRPFRIALVTHMSTAYVHSLLQAALFIFF